MTSKTCLVLLLSFVLLTAASCAPDEKAEKANVEQQFIAEYESLDAEKTRLAGVLQGKIKAEAAVKKTTNLSELVAPDDEDVLALREIQNRQSEILEQLVKNDPNNIEHRFRLALSHFQRNDVEPGIAILQKISPLETAGHPRGHLMLAKYYVSRSSKSANIETSEIVAGEKGFENRPASSKEQAAANLNSALKHLQHCLTLDQNNVEALRIKAALLNTIGQLVPAYESFERLFANDPKYFSVMCQINSRLGRPEKNVAVIDSAIQRYDQLLSRPEPLTDRQSLFAWQELCKCYTMKKDFPTIEARLIEAFQLELPAGESVLSDELQAAGKRLLSRIYSAWATNFPTTNDESARNRLELVRKAHQLEERNPVVLRELTIFGGSENEAIASEAKSIYDAKNDFSAPASVLKVLGTQEMAAGDNNAAILYLERARSLAPADPEVANNLAFAYLENDSANAKRALGLADEAIRLSSRNPRFQKFQTFFQDTRGQALMQLQRTQEAMQAFELALTTRPQNTKILQALIACCQEIGVPATRWENQLRNVQESTQSAVGVGGQ